MIPVLLSALAIALPDVVELESGERCVGSLRSSPGDSLLLITPAGTRELDADEVQRCQRRADLLPSYRKLRVRAVSSDRGRWVLADWCRRHGMFDLMLDELDALALEHADDVDRWVGEHRSTVLLDLTPPPRVDWHPDPAHLLRVAANDSKPGRASVARHWLADVPLEASLPVVSRSLRKAHVTKRRLAANLLAEWSAPRSLNVLAEAALYDADETVRDTAVSAIRELEHPQKLGPFLDALRSPQVALRMRTVQVLESLANFTAVPALINQLHPQLAQLTSGGSPVRAHIAFGEQRSFVQDFEVEIAQGAVIADPVIGVLQTGVVLDVGVAGVFTVAGAERRRIARALGKLSGRPYGTDHQRWVNWWKSEGLELWRAQQPKPPSQDTAAPASDDATGD